jgi:hypothetical protein
MRSLHIRFLKSLLLLIGLGMIAVLIACGGSGGSSNHNPPPAISVSLGGAPSSLLVLNTVQITATVSNDSAGKGVTWSCTPANACGSFNSSTTASGTPVTYTAPIVVPSSKVVITATSVSDTTKSASTAGITINGGLADGNYVFSVTGTDTNSGGSSYANAGVFVVASGAITGGEEDYSDKAVEESQEPITGGSITSTADGNLEIALTFSNPKQTGNPDPRIASGAATGTTTFHASLVSTSKALLMEYDGWAVGSGQLNLQATSLAAPSGSFAFYMNGGDFYGPPISLGGVINVDGSGTVSGTGSSFDINDSCNTHLPCTAATYFGQALTAGTVTVVDSLGYVTFQLPADCTNVATDPNLCNGGPTGSASTSSLFIDGYMIDSTHIQIIEDWYDDELGAYVAGSAIRQTGAGSFSTSSVAGSTYVVGLEGSDSNGPLQVAGQLAFPSSGSTVTGTLSYNDLALTNAQGGSTVSGLFTVSSLGTVSVTGLTDGTVTFGDLQLYLTGDGHAFVISMDSTAATNPDVMAGLSQQQAASTFNVASVSGNYALDTISPSGATEADAVGGFTSNGTTTITGYQDENDPFIPALVADHTFTNTYASTSTNGVFGVTNSGGTFNATVYLIDGTQGVIIENDTTGLTLGYFTQQ